MTYTESYLIEELRGSRELQELRDEAGISVELDRSLIERGDKTVVTLYSQEEFIPEFMGQEDPNFIGWKKTAVKGYFSDGSLEKVSLENGELAGPLAGHGEEYVYENGEVNLISMWMA